MGQYHCIVNLDKKEAVWPHELACGLKLWEQIAGGGWKNGGGTGGALLALLACSNGRGGGDLNPSSNYDRKTGEGIVGRWAGDRIAVVGDSSEEGDFGIHEGDPPLVDLYDIAKACTDDYPEGSHQREHAAQWTDITSLVVPVMEAAMEGKFVGDGWKEFIRETCPKCGAVPAASHGRPGSRVAVCPKCGEFPLAKSGA